MKKQKLLIFIILFSFLLFPAGAPRLSAAEVITYEDNPDFNANYLLEDDELFEYTAMSIEQIRDFAKEKGGTLDTYIDPENGMVAYWVIWHTAQEFQVSPKFLLTLMQKEQSLVTDDTPDQSQYDWATGYSCYGGICLDIFRGFTKQVRSAAKKFREYMDDLNVLGKHQTNFYCTFTKWCLGKSKMTQDQIIVTPQSKATAALYTYNPYRGNTIVDGYKIGANYNFWKIWQSWFKVSTFRPNSTLLKSSGNPEVYLIKDGIKQPFSSFSALVSRYDPRNIVTVKQEELDKFTTGPEIKFAQYSLLINPQGDIFLLVDDKLRHIVSMEVFRTLGFNPEELIEVTATDLESFSIGQDLTLEDSYPTGALLQDSTTQGIYYVQGGIKYPIYSPEILKVNYPNQTILKGHSEELNRYPKGSPIKFRDGTLIKAKNDSKVYVISDGQKLHLKDEQAFLSRGYKWENIIETTDQAVAIHPSGPALAVLATTTPSSELIKDETNKLEQAP